MIEISISRELAAKHPGFMAGCAERGHQVEVFDSDEPGLASRRPTTCDRAESRRRTPGARTSACTGPGGPQPSVRRRRDGRPNHDERRPLMAR